MRNGQELKHLTTPGLIAPELPQSLQGAWRWLYEGAPELLHGGGAAKGPRDECGVFGIYGHPDAARLTYYGLYALQHRGQESAGIATLASGQVRTAKGMGLVSEIFDEEAIADLPGTIALGHTRYSTTGSSNLTNAQPVVAASKRGHLAIAHNGNLVDAMLIRDRLESEGAIFSSTVDTEVIMHLLVRSKAENLEDAMIETLQQVHGGYALILLGDEKMIGVRDPHGIRPLCLGKLGEAWLLASESCAFDTVGAEFVREIAPGEMVVVGPGGVLRSRQAVAAEGPSRICMFEYIYFARPDTNLQGVNVHTVRKEMGRSLAREAPVEADLVMGVPDSSISAATGFAEESGIPYEMGLIKNRYIGRTFISPNQKTRVQGVRLKLNPLRKVIEGKRVVLVDDSIVRGTTSRHLVALLREAGAREVHMRISSPPYRNACHYGIDTSATQDLVATGRDENQIRDYIGADSLHFLSVDGIVSAVGTAVPGQSGFCLACFNSDYPVEIPEGVDKFALEVKGCGC